MISSVWNGHRPTPTTFTAAIAVPDPVEVILSSLGKLYVDNVGGTFGTTQVSNTLLKWGLSVTTGIIPRWGHDGDLDFGYLKYTMPEVVLEVTYEHTAGADAEKVLWLSETPRLISLVPAL